MIYCFLVPRALDLTGERLITSLLITSLVALLQTLLESLI